MKTIWKWTLAITEAQTVLMPAGAQILSVQMQGGMPQVWALCDPQQPREPRVIEIYGTGNPAPDNPGRHISSFQMHGDSLVWHVFEVPA